MAKNKELEAFYQSVYLKGEKKHFTPFVTKGTTSSEAQEVIKEMKWKGKRVLDVGCGTGNFAKEVSKNNAKYVLGIDYAEEAIKIAQKNNKQKNLEFKNKIRLWLIWLACYSFSSQDCQAQKVHTGFPPTQKQIKGK